MSTTTLTTILPAEYGLPLKNANLLLTTPYLPLEAGIALTKDGMHHIAASTYMKSCTSKMITWWFGWVHNTEQYKLWHPRDHVFSDWIGPRGNNGDYIGGHHLVKEYIGGSLAKLKISFVDPGVYFGDNWEREFKENGYEVAICGRIGRWDPKKDSDLEKLEAGGVQVEDTVYTGHLIHLIKEEEDGVRMRSRFWLGDFEGVEDVDVRKGLVPEGLAVGVLKHATEEMAILGTILPELYRENVKCAKI